MSKQRMEKGQHSPGNESPSPSVATRDEDLEQVASMDPQMTAWEPTEIAPFTGEFAKTISEQG